MYPLTSLLNLRLYREDKAKNEVVKQEKICAQEQEKLKQLHQEAERYKAQIPALVEAEYAKIMGKPCTLQDIDAVKHQVAVIEQGLVLREMKADEQRLVLQDCQQRLHEAKQAVVFARKEAAKIEKHKEIWLEIQKKEAERLEDLEMEEFQGIKQDFFDF